MSVNRRQTLGLLGTALAAPYILRTSSSAGEPVEYVRVCNAFGPGFFFVPGTDVCLRVSGDRARGFFVAAIKDPDDGERFATLDSYDLAGDFQDGSPLGSESGETDGSRANLVAMEGLEAARALAIFSAPATGATPAQSDEIYAQPFSAMAEPLDGPIRISGDLDGGYTSLYTARIGDDVAVGYTHNTTAGFRARLAIVGPDGNRTELERAVSSGTGDLEFLTNLVVAGAGQSTSIYSGLASVENGFARHGVQRAAADGARRGEPIWIRVPRNGFIHGSVGLLPNPDGGFTAAFWAGVEEDNIRAAAANGRADLHLQRFARNGDRGPIKKVGRQEVDNFGLVGNFPHLAWTPSRNILVATEGVGEILIWLLRSDFRLLSKQRLRRSRRGRLRLRRLRRFRNLFAISFTESDISQTLETGRWGVEIFSIRGEP